MRKSILGFCIGAGGLALSHAATAATINGSLDAAGEVDFHAFTLNLDATAAADRILIIDTEGSALAPNNDTEIGVYTPGGTLVANDDDSGSGLLSRLTFGSGGANGDLAAGAYSIALGGFDTTFANGPTVISSSGNTGPYAINLNLYEFTDSVLGSGALSSGTVESFALSLVNPIIGAEGGRLVIDTEGSNFDTELGLFDDATGNLVANDDDGGTGLLSRLAFGAGLGSLGDLAAGDYTVYIGGYNTSFANGPSVTPGTASGDYVINVRQGILIPGGVTLGVPAPATLVLLGMGLAGLALRGRRGRRA